MTYRTGNPIIVASVFKGAEKGAHGAYQRNNITAETLDQKAASLPVFGPPLSSNFIGGCAAAETARNGHPEAVATCPLLGEDGVTQTRIVLGPLSLDGVSQLLCDALRGEPATVRPLAELVHRKTGGNPFFAGQFLTSLAEEGLLAFDPPSLSCPSHCASLQGRCRPHFQSLVPRDRAFLADENSRQYAQFG
jgi:hypothetical protein